MPTPDQIQDILSLSAAAQRVISAAAPITLTNNPSGTLWQALLDAIGEIDGAGLSDEDRQFIEDSLATVGTGVTAAQTARVAAEAATRAV